MEAGQVCACTSVFMMVLNGEFRADLALCGSEFSVSGFGVIARFPL